MINKVYITYNDYGVLVSKLTDKIEKLIKKNKEPFTHIYGIPRGGLPIAVHLSHHLKIKNIELEYNLSSVVSNSKKINLLVCDDVVDSGNSMKYIASVLKEFGYKFKTVSLHFKPRSGFIPDIYVNKESNDSWLVYPWEYDDTPDKAYMLE